MSLYSVTELFKIRVPVSKTLAWLEMIQSINVKLGESTGSLSTTYCTFSNTYNSNLEANVPTDMSYL